MGHRWEAPLARISNSGSWCPTCRHHVPSIDDMRRLADKRGGRCLSETYVNAKTPLQWRCAKHHTWWSMPHEVQRGKWCAACAKVRRLEVEEFQRIARKRGGQLLSTAYLGGLTPLWWRCANGHYWLATPSAVKGGGYRPGTWCLQCSNLARRGRAIEPLTLEEMKDIARERGGECLSDSYVRCDVPLRWRCAKGHEWLGKPWAVKYGYWCPRCGRREISYDLLVRTAGEHGVSLISAELELSSAASVLTWECAKGHRWEGTAKRARSGSWCPQCATNRSPTIQDMQELARSRGGECLSKRYVNVFTPLRWRCARGHIWKASPNKVRTKGHGRRGTWCPRCPRPPVRSLEAMKEIARSRGGECLSEQYSYGHVPLTWRCGRGHVWKAKPNQIMDHGKWRGTWCRRCANEKEKPTIEQMQALAREKGGECLSKKYVDHRQPLQWRCEKGHRWSANPRYCRDRWCPVCNRKPQRRLNQLTIEHMRELAQSKGGECLSQAYVDSSVSLRWRCAAGHEWNQVPKRARRDWCCTCTRIQRMAEGNRDVEGSIQTNR